MFRFIVLLATTALAVYLNQHQVLTEVFGAAILVGALMAGLCCTFFPKTFFSIVNKLFLPLFCSVRCFGLNNVPEKGGGILVANHVSYLDPLVLSFVLGRPVRILVYDTLCSERWFKYFARFFRIIKVPTGSKDTIKALDEAAALVRSGALILVFAEGDKARVGNILPFTQGFRRIKRGCKAPVIPVYFDASAKGSRFFRREERIVSFGEQMNDDPDAYQVRRAVAELGTEVAKKRHFKYNVLHLDFLKRVKKQPLKFAMANATGFELTYLQTFAYALALSFKLSELCKKNRFIGVMLPSSVESVLTNLAIYFNGCVPININYTVPDSFIYSVEEQTGLKTIVSSKALLNKIGKNPLNGMLFVEELIAELPKSQLFLFKVAGLLLPQRLLRLVFGIKGGNREDLATIIFSSGSTGEPKGVMLKQSNVTTNFETFVNLEKFKHTDGIMGILPFFHSFGFTTIMWMPIVAGVKAIYHHNPLDAGIIGKCVEKYKLTILVGTPTFLTCCAKKCTKEQFASLRTVISGAERLKKRCGDEFYEKFGVKIYEGYGCTETSPIVTMSAHSYAGIFGEQVAYKESTAGRPINYVSIKILDINSGKELGPNQEGLLYVKGPNIMAGYYGKEELTNEVLQDGWYRTGDIAICDDDGFVQITDRISRFSKIAGEMVPHIKPEEMIHEALGRTDRVCVVSGVPDPKRGERLVVLHILDDINPREIGKKLSEMGLANLWIPKPDDFYRVDALPMLGSGKLDLRGVKLLALEVVNNKDKVKEVKAEVLPEAV